MTASSWAQDVEPVPTDVAQKFGEALVKAAAKIDKLQVKIEGDPANSVGVSVPEEGGVILVPQKGIDEENTPDMTVANGVPLALYFSTPNIVPMIDGKLIDRGKLHGVTVTDDQGKEHEANCMLLTVRKISDEDYRLYGFGKAAKPLIDVRFTDGKGPGTKPLAVEIKDIEGQTGSLVVTVFDKYQAKFRGGVTE
jgi:hypothetical protein